MRMTPTGMIVLDIDVGVLLLVVLVITWTVASEHFGLVQSILHVTLVVEAIVTVEAFASIVHVYARTRLVE